MRVTTRTKGAGVWHPPVRRKKGTGRNSREGNMSSTCIIRSFPGKGEGTQGMKGTVIRVLRVQVEERLDLD